MGIVGESGCGKSMMLRTLIGLLPRGGRVTGGQIVFQGTDLLSLDKKQLRDVRGRSIGMIFQEPMTALNPVMQVGEQIAEGPICPPGLHEEGGTTASVGADAAGGHPGRGEALSGLSQRTLGRDAPAGHDRYCALVRAEADPL